MIKAKDTTKIKESVKKVKKKQVKKNEFGINIEEMAKAGVNFGHRISIRHPKMKPYLTGTKSTVHIINLEKTVEKLEQALKFIQEIASEGKSILLVGTKIQHRELIKELAHANNLPYIVERWLGGTFTNFEVIRKRNEYFKDLERKQKEGELEKYTKKENIRLNRELVKLRTKFEGTRDMNELPGAILVIDARKDAIAVKEARMKNIKVIALVDTNIDPTLIDYPIPANDDAISSVKYILDKVDLAFKTKKSKSKEEEKKEEKKEVKKEA